MPFRLLLAASPSFNKWLTLPEKLNYYLKGKINAELHVITTKHWTQEIKDYAARYGHTVQVYVRDFAMDGHLTTKILYEQMVTKCDGAVVFWDQESKFEAMLIKMLAGKKHYVEVFESLKQELERTKPERKAARKPKIVLTMPAWCKDKYIEAHKENQERNTPQAVKDHGYVKTNIPKGTTNGLTNFMCNYFNWKGHHLERINNQGVNRNGVWTKGSGTNGTSDIGGHFNRRKDFAIPIKPEVKTGKDQLSNDQVWFAKKMERTGAIYTVITCFEDVFKFYEYLESLP